MLARLGNGIQERKSKLDEIPSSDVSRVIVGFLCSLTKYARLGFALLGAD